MSPPDRSEISRLERQQRHRSQLPDVGTDGDESTTTDSEPSSDAGTTSSPDRDEVSRRERQQRHRSQLPDVGDDDDSDRSSSGSSSSGGGSSPPDRDEVSRQERQQRHREQLPDIDPEPTQPDPSDDSGGGGGLGDRVPSVDEVRDTAGDVGSAVGSTVSGGVDRAREGAGNVASGAADTVSSGIDAAQDAADNRVREWTDGDVGVSQDWTSTADSGGVGNVIDEATDPITDPVTDAADDFRDQTAGSDGEHFGDLDWSAGLGDPDTDEVEEFVGSLPDRAEDTARDVTEPVVDAFQGEGASPFSGESAGHALLDTAGFEGAADTYQGGVETFGEEIVPQTAAGVAGLPGAGLEAAELVATRENVDDLPAGAAAAGQQQVEFIREEPATAGAGIVGGAAAGAGFGRFLGDTRLGTGRTGEAMRRLDLDPGSRAVTEGQRAIGSVRDRLGSQDADLDADPVPTGRSDVGSRGTGSLFDADAVDEARGVSGPSRLDVTRGNVRRRIQSAREQVSDNPFGDFATDDRGQLQYGGQRGRPDAETGGSETPQFRDFDADRDPSRPPDAGGTFEDVRQDALTQTQDQLRGAATRPDAGDYEPSPNPFGQDRGPTMDPETGEVDLERSQTPTATPDAEPEVRTADADGGAGGAGLFGAAGMSTGATERQEQAQQPEVTGGTSPTRGREDTGAIPGGIFGEGDQTAVDDSQEPTVGTFGVDDEAAGPTTDDDTRTGPITEPGAEPDIGTGPIVGTRPDTQPDTTVTVTPDPDPEPTPDPEPGRMFPNPDPDPDPRPDPDPDPDPDPEPRLREDRRRDEEFWQPAPPAEEPETVPFQNPIASGTADIFGAFGGGDGDNDGDGGGLFGGGW